MAFILIIKIFQAYGQPAPEWEPLQRLQEIKKVDVTSSNDVVPSCRRRTLGGGRYRIDPKPPDPVPTILTYGNIVMFQPGYRLKPFQAYDLKRLCDREDGKKVGGVLNDTGMVLAYEMGYVNLFKDV